MKNFFILISLCLLVFASGCDTNKDPEDPTPTEPVESGYKGPDYPDDYTSISSWANRSRWNLANVHDPTVVKDGEYFYMYQTDASYGNVHVGQGHYPYRRSKDLVNWEFQGMAFNTAPAWVKDSLNNKRTRIGLEPISNPTYGFWAPYITKVGNKFRLYYSIVVEDPIVGNDRNYSWTERAFIGLAESDDLGSNVWVDKGMVVASEPDGVETYTRTGNNDWSGYFKFNAIDPTFIVTPEGEHWLIYGSWHSGTAALKLNPETGKPDKLETIEDYGVRIAGRGNIAYNRWQALEGPEIIYNEETGYYYLFLAYDELSVAYNTRVARSTSITGPYLGYNGENVSNGADAWPMLTHPYAFSGHTGWVGFSHCSVFQDPDTEQWFYASQARLPENVPGIGSSNAVMMGHIREIYWTEDGWPAVAPERYAAVPETEITKESIVGKWEQIIMEYDYQAIQRSKTLTLSDDNTVSGSITGTWSYDNASRKLTINGIELIVDNAWDWEASPRKETITYSGFTDSGRPVWGKKIN